ncbi:protein ACCELERATED CELL DEATH 6-like [Lotus japonicus]|uniref:protein ACCELERATED CELL DEATH 6-like n=1 Tax=Lotus japonicus TaxID=34305 RepID=UPI0025849BD7|nr:protein ACCELERATED CELL DEATH 6-like [Lotus japonicus]
MSAGASKTSLSYQGGNVKFQSIRGSIMGASKRDSMSGEHYRKVENFESKTPSESEIEATAGHPHDNTLDLQSPQIRTILGLVEDCDKCTDKICQFIEGPKNDIAGDGEMQEGLVEFVKEKHGHNKNNWKLLRDAYLSKKDYNKINNLSNLWNDLLESEIFEQKSPVGNTVLHIAAENGDEDLVEEIVRQAPYLLTEKSFSGDTALHVAAKTGHFSALQKLIVAHFKNSSESYYKIQEAEEKALEKILEKNNDGNTFFHEALINGRHGVMNFLLSHGDSNLKKVAKGAALSVTSNEKKSGVYLAIESGYKHVVDQALSDVIPKHSNYIPQGKSLLLAAIIKEDQDILETILAKMPKWIHLSDTQGRIPLHYAASTGYLKGVQNLLKKCDFFVMEMDKNGFLPIHLASCTGQVKVVQELLKSDYCPDPRDIVHKDGRNILHLAAQSGKFNVVKYILHASSSSSSNHGLVKMINEQDCNGNTPLHLATMYCHPKIVHTLTWDKRVDLCLVNRKGQTALDVFGYSGNPSLRQRLTWTALKSSGVRSAEPKSLAAMVPPETTYINLLQQEGTDMDPYKDRINTLIVVSTLIITATFATGFALPGGINGSGDPGPGMAVMLHHIWFKIFIFCNTISMYGAISVTIILIWAQLGDITLALLALKVARPLLGITLATLSLAFLAGVHLVIRDLTWLDTSFLAMGLFFIFMLLLLYTMLWFPSSTSKLVLRHISYYPFLLLASLVEPDQD